MTAEKVVMIYQKVKIPNPGPGYRVYFYEYPIYASDPRYTENKKELVEKLNKELLDENYILDVEFTETKPE